MFTGRYVGYYVPDRTTDDAETMRAFVDRISMVGNPDAHLIEVVPESTNDHSDGVDLLNRYRAELRSRQDGVTLLVSAREDLSWEMIRIILGRAGAVLVLDWVEQEIPDWKCEGDLINFAIDKIRVRLRAALDAHDGRRREAPERRELAEHHRRERIRELTADSDAERAEAIVAAICWCQLNPPAKPSRGRMPQPVNINRIAKRLNVQGIETRRGRRWSHSQVKMILNRNPDLAHLYQQAGGK